MGCSEALKDSSASKRHPVGDRSIAEPEGSNGALNEFYTKSSKASLFAEGKCIDPDLKKVSPEVRLTLCDGSIVMGQAVSGSLKSLSCDESIQLDCLASSEFPAVKKSLIQPGILKKGVILAGIEGLYPSAEFPLAVDSASQVKPESSEPPPPRRAVFPIDSITGRLEFSILGFPGKITYLCRRC